MVGPLEAAQESAYKLTVATQSGPGATLDKHCHMVVPLPEAQPLGPGSHLGLLQIPRHSLAQGAASLRCSMCVGANSVINKKSNIY